MAPSRIWPAITFISGVPASCLVIQAVRIQANSRARTPVAGIR